MRKCRHVWVTQAYEYTPPIRTVTKVDRVSEDFMLKVCYGITNIIDRCANCNQVNVTEAIGKVGQHV